MLFYLQQLPTGFDMMITQKSTSPIWHF